MATLTPVLAAAMTAGTSTDITVEDAPVTVGMHVAAGALPRGARLSVQIKTPGANVEVAELVPGNSTHSLTSRGVYVVERPALAHLGVGVGAYTYTA